MKINLKHPIYIAQCLSGLAAIGGIFADGKVTHLRLYLAGVVLLATIATVSVAVRNDLDSQDTKEQMATLLRSMELPYFIIEKISATISGLAQSHGWNVGRQENFQHETVYSFEKSNTEGLLSVTEDEFKELWTLDKKQRVARLKERLFGEEQRDTNEVKEQNDRFLSASIREAISQEISGPHGIVIQYGQDGTWVFTLRRSKDDAGIPVFAISSEDRRALDKMLPIERYAMAATKAKATLVNTSMIQT